MRRRDRPLTLEGGIIITGGGTAGHVLPALAVAQQLVILGHENQSIHFVGARNGMESTLVPEAGFSITLLPGRGVVRRLSVDSVSAVIGLLVAFARALALMGRRRPAAVVTVGGYAGIACSLAAGAFGIPVIVVNLDAVPGAANRLVGRFAAASAVALPGTALPRAVVTGAPVRSEVLAVDRSPQSQARAREVLGIDETRRIVAIVGGSLGARRLNEAGVDLARRLADRADLLIYQVAGRRDFAMVEDHRSALGLDPSHRLDYRVVAFEQHLPELLAAADVAICRAGASTIAELTVIGTPSVLVPLPDAPSDHQLRNAELLAKEGAAILVRDDEASADRLGVAIDVVLSSDDRAKEMSHSAQSLGRPDAAHQVAVLIEDVLRSHRSHRVMRHHGGAHEQA